MISGILNINKPKGKTSHDVVAAVRKITGIKKVGHTGTLDPNATGVLILCLGKATKLVQNLTKKEKVYIAKMHLGIRTDTQDSCGKTINEKDPSGISPELFEKALESFTGEIEQVPPMYSAVKIKGQRLYKLARKGLTVERPAKKVLIHRLELKKFDLPHADFEAETSAGVYIRTLCDDIGESLGCGGHLAELERTKVGDFKLEDSLTLEDLEKAVAEKRVEGLILPLEKFLQGAFPKGMAQSFAENK